MMRFLVLAISLLLCSGCGYSAVKRSAGPLLGRSIEVKMFANRTYQPNVEAMVRRFLLDEIRGTDAADIFQGENGADLSLSGAVESLEFENSAFSPADKAMMYRAVLTVDANLRESSSGKVVWKSRETVSQDYPANADTAIMRNARDAAVEEICREMAARLLSSIAQSF